MSLLIPYLSKIEIDHEIAYKAGLRDSYAWHQRTWDMFPNRSQQPRDFLTRLDDVDGGFRLLVLSETIPTRPDWCPTPSWETKSIDESFFTHGHYRFSLIANPSRKIKSDTNVKNGKRIPIAHRNDLEINNKIQFGLLSWLRRKGQQHGFSFEDSQIRTVQKPRQWFLKKGASGVHAATEFSGILTVTEPQTFRQAAVHGVGPAKAFGFGMLCLSSI